MNTDHLDIDILGGNKRPVLLLSIQNKRDSKLIKQMVDVDLNFKESTNGFVDSTFDLCIVDNHSFQSNKKQLRSLKKQAAPIFLPVLFLSQKKDDVRTSDSILKIADDVVYIPASSRLLEARIKMLLKQREYSLKLEEKNQQLKEEKQFTDMAIESLPELFFVVDEDQNFVRWNNRIEEQLGYTSDEVEQMHPLDFYREEDHQFIISKIANAFETGSAEAEVQMEAKSGELIPYYITTKKFKRGDKSFLVGSCINLSEIKEAQFELEKQRQLLDAIINQTKSLIYLKDHEGKYRLVNDSYLDFYNLEREAIIGKTDREVHGDEFANRVGKTDYQVLQNRESSSFEETRTGNGKSRLFHTIKYPLSGVPGFENSMCGISTDITDLKQASSRLRERIKEQQCLYNISNLPEHANTVEELLEKAVTFLPKGWQFPEITEAAITFDGNSYITEDFRETEWKLSVESNRLEEKPLKVEVVYVEEKEIFKEEVFLKEEQQLIDSVVETLSSQIERLHAQKRLKESEKRWGNLVKNDPNLIQILEPNGTIQFINEAGAKMLGYRTPDEAVGKNYFDLIGLEDDKVELVSERVQKVLEGKEIDAQTYKIRDLKGDILYLESQAVPTTLDDGRKGIQQVAKDVTDREQYERRLKESLSEKETLLQEIHHRVKNNLAVVSGMMELQTFNTKNEEVRSLMADSKNRIKTMALIHEKLYQSESLSQIEFGTYVKDLLENIRYVSSVSDKIELNLEYDSFNMNVNQAVPCALIINEIVSNAYEHAFVDRKDGCINVVLQKREEDKIFVQVKDNGRGLSDNFMDEKDDSIGFTIIGTLIKQLQAEAQIDSEDGLNFSFSFTKQEIKGSSSSLISR